MTPVILKMPPLLVVGNLEKELAQHDIPEVGDVVFDFADTVYMDAPSLVLILAIITKFQRSGRKLLLNLPTDKRVRDFLRSWLFPDAVQAQTGRLFRGFTTTDSHKYFGENPKPSSQGYLPRQRFDPFCKKVVEVRDGYYIPFQIYDRDSQPFNDSLALAECASWSGPFVWQVLSKCLNKDPDHVVRHIVFEAMVNAVRHPNASHIAVVSQVGRKLDKADEASEDSKGGTQPKSAPPKKTIPSHVTMVWWDDGDSIIDTLKKPLLEGRPVRSVEAKRHRSFNLKISDVNGAAIDRIQVETDLDLSGDTQEELLLLSSVFPGVTRDPNATAAVPPGRTASAVDNQNDVPPGMGLYLLVNAAVDLYGGEVSFRSKNYFLNIKRSKDGSQGHYKAKIIKLPPKQDIPGNMLTVRLPRNTH